MDRIRGSFGKHEGSLRNWSGDFRICAWKLFNCFISSFHGSFVLIGKPFSFTMEVLICSRRINVLVLNFYKHTRCYCWFCDDFKALLQNYWAVYVFHNYTGLFFSTLPKKGAPCLSSWDSLQTFLWFTLGAKRYIFLNTLHCYLVNSCCYSNCSKLTG